jgi:RimJ/RimL family protein N-acetyltransferase
MPFIETERLILSPIMMADLPSLTRLWQDPQVTRYLPGGIPRSEDATRVELEYMQRHWAEHGFGVWGIRLREEGELIGYCGLQQLHVEPGGVTSETLPAGTEVEIVAGIGRKYWHQGIVSEAAHAALRHGFEEVGLKRVVAAAHPENHASIRVLTRLGMMPQPDMNYYNGVPHFTLAKRQFRAADTHYNFQRG